MDDRLRQRILAQDGYRCCKCGEVHRQKLQIHRIESLEEYALLGPIGKKLQEQERNIITLCDSCETTVLNAPSQSVFTAEERAELDTIAARRVNLVESIDALKREYSGGLSDIRNYQSQKLKLDKSLKELDELERRLRGIGRTRLPERQQEVHDSYDQNLQSAEPTNRKEVRPMQAYCVKCRAKKEMKDTKATTMKNGKPATQGICPTCGTKMFRIGKA